MASAFRKWVYANGGVVKVAKKLSVHEKTIYRWLNHQSQPQLKQVKKIIRLSKGKLTLNDIVKGT